MPRPRRGSGVALLFAQNTQVLRSQDCTRRTMHPVPMVNGMHLIMRCVSMEFAHRPLATCRRPHKSDTNALMRTPLDVPCTRRTVHPSSLNVVAWHDCIHARAETTTPSVLSSIACTCPLVTIVTMPLSYHATTTTPCLLHERVAKNAPAQALGPRGRRRGRHGGGGVLPWADRRRWQ